MVDGEVTWQVSLVSDLACRTIVAEGVSSADLSSAIDRALVILRTSHLPGTRTHALMVTSMEEAYYGERRVASRKGKRRHKTAVEWQRVIADMKRAQRAQVRAAKPKRGGVLYYENPCSVQSWHCELNHDGQGGHTWN